MSRHTMAFIAVAAALGASAAVNATDASAGGKIVAQVCSACHDPASWKGKSATQIDALIHKVGAGKVMHPIKLTLTNAQMADVAAYWAQEANK